MKGYYDRSKSKKNRGMFKKGVKSPRWLVNKRVSGRKKRKPRWDIDLTKLNSGMVLWLVCII